LIKVVLNFKAEKMELELTLIINSRAKIMWNLFN